MPKTLFILNDPPYGTERSYNALRLAGALSKRDGEDVKVFLVGDAASCAKKDQKVPQGCRDGEDDSDPGRRHWGGRWSPTNSGGRFLASTGSPSSSGS